jgi:hypothetical protein
MSSTTFSFLLVLSFVAFALAAHGVTTNPNAAETEEHVFVSAAAATDLTGVWSGIGDTVDGNKPFNTKFVQQGNTLLGPSTSDPRVPNWLNVTLYDGYGYGQGALWSLIDHSFCSYVRPFSSELPTTNSRLINQPLLAKTD